MTHDNAEQLPDELIELVSDADIEAVWGNANFGSSDRREVIFDTVLKVAGDWSTGSTAFSICHELGLITNWRTSRNVNLTKKGKRYLYYSVKNTRVQPTPASAMDGGILKALKYLMEYVEELEKAGFGSCEENPAYQQAMEEITEAAIQPVMDQEIKRPKLGDWKKSRDTLQGSAYDQLVPETLQPVADFTDKYNSSDKPWCCWINQESGEECKNPARWDIRWPPFGYEDNTQSCDDHIFNLRGEGKNEITKIPEPVAAPDMVMVPREPTEVMINAYIHTFGGKITTHNGTLKGHEAKAKARYKAMIAAAGKA